MSQNTTSKAGFVALLRRSPAYCLYWCLLGVMLVVAISGVRSLYIGEVLILCGISYLLGLSVGKNS